MTYDWKALAIFLAVLFAVGVVGRFLVFRVPDLKALRDKNTELDVTRKAALKEALGGGVRQEGGRGAQRRLRVGRPALHHDVCSPSRCGATRWMSSRS
jgi:hypothetical protein